MGKITIGLGFLRMPDHEEFLRAAAGRLPEDWTIEMTGQNDIISTTVIGPDFRGNGTFGPGRIEDATVFLEGLANRFGKS